MSVTPSGPPTERDEDRRPLGISLLTLLFGFSGIGLIVGGFAFGGELSQVDVEVHAAIEWLLFIVPFAFIGWGIIGVVAGVWLWQGKSTGVTAGIVFLVVALLGEFLLHATVFISELTYDDMGFGGLPDILRIFIIVGLLVYLWRLDSGFIKEHKLFDVPEYVS